MRVSTNGSYQRSLGLMQQLTAALDHTQRQISSGRRLLSPSDDPIASARTLELQESVTRLGQLSRNGEMARNRLSFEEAALGSINDVMQRVRELALQANNATQSNESRSLIAAEMREHLDSMLQLANSEDGHGRFLFSGNMDNTKPVGRTGTTYTYNGDQGQRMVQIGDNRQVADGDPGEQIFFRVRNGNGEFSATALPANVGTGVLDAGSVTDQSLYNQDQYTIRFIDANNYEVLDSAAAVVATGPFESGGSIAFSGIQVSIAGEPAAGDEFDIAPSTNNDIFAAIEALAMAVETNVGDATTRADMNNGINAGILLIDQAIGNVIDTRTRVGSRLAAIETQDDSNAGTVIALRETIGDLNDLDYTEALSRLSIESSILEAAQQSFLRLQSLSLFNYL